MKRSTSRQFFPADVFKSFYETKLLWKHGLFVCTIDHCHHTSTINRRLPWRCCERPVWVMDLQKSSDSLGFDMIWLGCVGAVGPFWFLHRTCARLCVGSVVFSLAACYLGLVSAAWPLRRYRNASRPKMTLAIFQLLVPESSTANPFQLFNHEEVRNTSPVTVTQPFDCSQTKCFIL